MSANITHLSEATFAEELSSSSVPVLVDFWAEWCTPCKMIAPILDEIASEHPDAIKIAKVNVDENNALAVKHNVMSIPTIVVFRDGVEVQRLIGAKSKAGYLEELAPIL